MVYTCPAGKKEIFPEKKLKMPALPDLRRQLQKAKEER
jgi:hypothetical protein